MTYVQFYSKTKIILIAGKLGLLPLSKAEAVGGDPPTHLPRHQLCCCQGLSTLPPIYQRKIRQLSEPLGGQETGHLYKGTPV
jgi:hypothetical protein